MTKEEQELQIFTALLSNSNFFDTYHADVTEDEEDRDDVEIMIAKINDLRHQAKRIHQIYFNKNPQA